MKKNIPMAEQSYGEAYKAARRKARWRIVVCVLLAVCAMAAAQYLDTFWPSIPFLPLLIAGGVSYATLRGFESNMRRLMAYTSLLKAETEFARECRDDDAVTRVEGLVVTRSWIYCRAPGDLFLMPLSEIVWLYEKRVNDMPSLVVHFRDGSENDLSLSGEAIEVLLPFLGARVPDAVVGYDKHLGELRDDGDNRALSHALTQAPKVLRHVPAFASPCYETVVYVKIGGTKKKCLLALTRERRLVLLCGERKLIDEDAANVRGIRRRGIGRLSLVFDRARAEDYTIKTYDLGRWRNVLRALCAGGDPCLYAAKGYDDVDSKEYIASQNRYYVRFAIWGIAGLFFCLITGGALLTGTVMDDGPLLAFATYILLPLVGVPAALYVVFWSHDGFSNRFFPKRPDGE